MSSDRAAALSQIAAEIAACTRCGLHAGRTKTVPGAGDPNAEIMFIGEGPGYHEDRQGLPFVGASGNYLETLLALIGLKREDVFIANVVKCRPPDNRDPLPAEIDACRPFLDRQCALIDPLIIVTLGRFSMARYFPGGKITQIHGKPKYDERRAYYPLFHPAAVLRNPALQSEMEADFRRIPEIVAAVRAKRAPASPPPADDPPPTQLKLF
jgi:DNA polymerase